jgi:hypothetical protein
VKRCQAVEEQRNRQDKHDHADDDGDRPASLSVGFDDPHERIVALTAATDNHPADRPRNSDNFVMSRDFTGRDFGITLEPTVFFVCSRRGVTA